MTSTIQNFTLEKHKKFLMKCAEQKIRNEIMFWIEYNVYDTKWANESLKNIVKLYWEREGIDEFRGFTLEEWTAHEEQAERNDKFDGVFYDSEYYVLFLIDQIEYKSKVKLDCEKMITTITTEELVKMVLKQKGFI